VSFSTPESRVLSGRENYRSDRGFMAPLNCRKRKTEDRKQCNSIPRINLAFVISFEVKCHYSRNCKQNICNFFHCLQFNFFCGFLYCNLRFTQRQWNNHINQGARTEVMEFLHVSKRNCAVHTRPHANTTS
jgi:hypothetical protein